MCYIRYERLKFSSRSREPSAAYGKLNLLIGYNKQSKDRKGSESPWINAVVWPHSLNVSTNLPTHTHTHRHAHTHTHTHKHVTVVTSCCLVTFLDDSTGSDNPHRIWGINAQSLNPMCVCLSVCVCVCVCVCSGYQTVFRAQMENSSAIDSPWCSPAAQVRLR